MDSLVSMPEEHMTLSNLFQEIKEMHVGWNKDFSIESVRHFPCGYELFAPSVIKGAVKLSCSSRIHDKQIWKFTVEEMHRLWQNGRSFYRNFDVQVHNELSKWSEA